jgi:hypothetical protein
MGELAHRQVRDDRHTSQGDDMLGFLGLLLLIWLAFIVIGAVVKGLFWLIIIGIVLFLATALYGWVKREAIKR